MFAIIIVTIYCNDNSLRGQSHAGQSSGKNACIDPSHQEILQD